MQGFSTIGAIKWLLFYLLFSWCNYAQGQVKFKVELMPDDVTYRVSMLPSVTWAPPLNITSTAQVIIVAPTGGFEVGNMTNLQSGTFWAQNARFDAPQESPNSDYIVFGLTSLGTTGFSYVAGVEVPLFTFKNTGICTGGLAIMENSDPFFPPNSLNVNANNQISTLGSGIGTNAYTGPYGQGGANCLAASACLVAAEIDLMPDGKYQVSIVSDTTWNAPNNTTDTLRIAVVAPTNTMTIGSLTSLLPGVSFALENDFIAPAANPNYDYFIFTLINSGTTGIPYIEGVKTPLFSFANTGSCNGNAVFIPDFTNDPFLAVNPSARMRLKTVGSGTVMEICAGGSPQPMRPLITGVSSVSSTACDPPNGVINISANSPANLQYSINNGTSWQPDYAFMNLGGGAYNISVRFENGTCPINYAQNPVQLNAPIAPQISLITPFNPSTCGINDGSIFIQASGNGQLQYSINGGTTWHNSHFFNNLAAGTYNVNVRNVNGTCIVDGGFITLTSPGTAPQIIAVNYFEPSTCGGNDGSISIEATGNGTIEYSINNGFTWTVNNTFNNLGNGTYNVQVRNATSLCAAPYNQNPLLLETPGCQGCIVEYELEILPDGKYQVSMTPYANWNFPQSITATAQVTIVVPTGGFYVANLINLLPDVEFKDNVRVDAPIENPDYDYIAFGLQTLGTSGIPYQNGVKVPLFTFENGGICTGPSIFLMDDNTDPFVPPNSVLSNVGQQLTTLGSGQDALVCIKQPNFVACTPEIINQLNAVNDAFSTFINIAVSGNVVTNDLNPGANILTVNQLPTQLPTHGVVTINSDGIFNYVPENGFIGIDQFQYLVCDNGLPAACDVATVTINILPPFTAINDHFNTTVNEVINGVVLPNDPNPSGAMPTTTVVTNPLNGVLVLNPNGSFIYTPNPGFSGTDAFIYQSCAAAPFNYCDTATVFLNIVPSVIAVNDLYATSPNTPINAQVLDNDTVTPGGTVTVNILAGSGPANGTFNLNPNGNFIYTPNPGFSGTDLFQYILCETSTVTSCDTANVTIVVTAGIVANDDQYTIPSGTILTNYFTINDLFPGSNIASIFILPGSGPTHGDITLNPNGSFTYTPGPSFTGEEIFDYVICDNHIPANCDTATVTISVQPSLEAIDDDIVLPQGGTLTGNVLDNDLNPNGNDLIVSLLPNSGPGNGVLILNPDGTYVYTPNPDFSGDDLFQYIVCDQVNTTDCDTAKVTIYVAPDLIANDDYFNILAGNNCSDDVTPNDLIPTGHETEVNLLPGSGPQNGTVQLNNNGTFNYIPNNGFIGTDYFDYIICLKYQPNICDTARIYVTTYQFAPPTPTTNCPTEVCSNQNIYLTVLQNYVGNSVNYTWYNGNYAIIGNGQTLDLPANSPLALPPFRARVTVDGHVTGYSAACNAVIGQLPVAIATNNGPVCPGEEVQLFANTGAGYQYEWRKVGQPGILSVSPNLIIPNASSSTTYEITIATAGCGNTATASTFVEVHNSANIANLTGGGTYCHGSAVTLSANNSTSNSGIVQYTWTGPAGFYYTSPAPGNGPFSLTFNTLIPENEGSYTLRIETQDGCISQPQSVIIDYLPQPLTPQLTVSDHVLCGGENLTLNSSLHTGNIVSYDWFQETQNGTVLIGTTAYPTFFANNTIASQSANYYVVVTVDGCTSDLSNFENVEVINALNNVVASNNTTATAPACEGENVTLNAPIIPGATYNWYGPGAFHSTLPNPIVPNISTVNSGTYMVIVEIPNCGTGVTATTPVYVSQIPTTPILTTNSPVCEGSELTFTVVNPSSNANLVYEYFYQPTQQKLDSTNIATTSLTNISMTQSGEYYVVATLNGCSSTTSISAMSMVAVDEMPPNIADAGTDGTICANIDEINLSAIAPSIGTGFWTSPTGAAIINPDQPNTLATQLADGQNLFVWQLSNGACKNYSLDSIEIMVINVPAETAFAGNDVHECGLQVVQLSANAPGLSSGAWSQPISQASSGVVISDISSPNPIISGLIPGQDFVFTWELSMPGCPAFSADEMTVNIAQPPASQAFIQNDHLVLCEESFATLQASIPQDATGIWTNNSGAIIANAGNPGTIASQLAEGENVFVWTLSSNGCPAYSSDSLIVFNEVLEVLADSWFVNIGDTLQNASLTENDVINGVNEWELTILSKPSKGEIIYLGNGEITYIPYHNAFGEDEMTYMLCSKNCAAICDVGKARFVLDQVTVDPNDCYIPNTITPNADGFNDTFIVPCTASYPGSSCKIFNRWGDIIFETVDYKNDWDGTYDGQPVQVGTYYYVIHLNNPDKSVFTGYVVVYRE